ncbi:MAG: NADH-quinone oxidoreductase subunit C, partial [Bradyrhizobium sp.]|nr:NADH-quinone oxidoreductase subunit C [Bradyrhizobium sp.]
MSRLSDLGESIKAALSGAVTGYGVSFDQLSLAVEANRIVDVVRYLRDDPSCRFVNITDST